MIITIILFLFFGIGIYLANKSYEYDFLGIVMSVLFGVCLFVHLFAWGFSSYEYNLFVEKRSAFVSTLENARKKGRDLEVAAITKDVAEWNKYLAVFKYNNTLFLLDNYVDDRINDLEPIE